MASTLHLYGELKECAPHIEHVLKRCPLGEQIKIIIRSKGGTFDAMHRIRKAVTKARKEKLCSFTVEVVEARSAALLLLLYFPQEERIITKKSKGVIHLPDGTFEGSQIRNTTINFLSTHTNLTPAKVILHENETLSGEKLVKYGFAPILKETKQSSAA